MKSGDHATRLQDRRISHPPKGVQSDLTKKDPSVETLRGLAIILVVLGHMIGNTSAGGMRVSDDSFLRYLYYSLEYIRLPLFTVISGWVYANNPVLPGNIPGFLEGKAHRLLVPMYVMGTLLFVFRMVIPGTNTTPSIEALPRNLIFPYDVYWFLFSLFLIFITVALLDTKPFFRKPTGWLVTLLGAFVFLYVSENLLDAVPNVFSFKGAAYLFPFFLLGTGIYRYNSWFFNDKVIFVILIAFMTSFAMQQAAWFGYLPLKEKHSVVGMTVGMSAAVLLFRLKLTAPLLVRIGSFAYGIFLFHVFFTGGSRIVLSNLGVENQFIMLVLGVVVAIAFSIGLELVIKKSNTLKFFFLGLRRTKGRGTRNAPNTSSELA